MAVAEPLKSDIDLNLVCSICHKHFSRLEHRKRHEQTHGTEQAFKCSACGKSFTRKDALRRHESAHRPSTSRITPEQDHLGPLRKACSACSAARNRCTGGQPCRHCATRNIECTYLTRKRKRSGHGADGPSATIASDASSASHVWKDISAADNVQTVDCPPKTDARRPSQSLETVSNEFESVSALFEPTATNRRESQRGPALNEDFSTGLQTPLQYESFQDYNSRGINWLPFDPSIGDDFSILPPDAGALPLLANFDETGLEAGGNRIVSLNHGWLPFDTDNPQLLHNEMSSLITSMTRRASEASRKSHSSKDDSLAELDFSLYADGAGARTSLPDRRMLETHRSLRIQDAASKNSGTSCPAWLAQLESSLRDLRDHDRWALADFESVLAEARSKIFSRHGGSRSLDRHLRYRDVFFDTETMKLFIQLYFENFHSIYPVLDPSLLCIPVWGWALCLATAALGTRYLHITEVTDFGDDLCSTLQEMQSREPKSGYSEDALPYIQARLLTTIGLCHSQRGSLMNDGYNAAALLCNACMRLRLLEEDDSIGAFRQGQDVEQAWIAWRFRETRRRTGLLIWLFDCMLAISTQTTPRFSSKLLRLKVPSSHRLWEAETSQKWFELHKDSTVAICSPQEFAREEERRLTIQQGAQQLWTNVSHPEPTSQFGTTAIIHVLIRRKWDANWYEDDPASASQIDSSLDSVRYLATIPEYTKWRNGTCDCLDILHWGALSVSAKAHGLEGPIFLQLHLARMVILSPMRELLKLGSSQGIATPTLEHYVLPHALYDVPPSDQRCREMVQMWASKDRYKARLAVIHAGSIFWHVRRYSTDSFIQPFATYLATILLWAYGVFAKLPTQTHVMSSTTGNPIPDNEGMEWQAPRVLETIEGTPSGTLPYESLPADSSETLETMGSSQPVNATESTTNKSTSSETTRKAYIRRLPHSIQIDRPMDDELVQHYIRCGDRMGTILEGVAELCSEQGPAQVVTEGKTILNATPNIWRVAENYSKALNRMQC